MLMGGRGIRFFFGLLTVVVVLAWCGFSAAGDREAATIELGGERIVLRSPLELAEPGESRATEVTGVRRHVVLAFSEDTEQGDLESLRAAGVEFLHKVPGHSAFIASVPQTAGSALERSSAAEGWAVVPARSKLGHKAKERLERGRGDSFTEAMVIFYRDVSEEDREQYIRAAGLHDSQVSEGMWGNRIEVETSFERLAVLADMDGVQTVWTDLRPKATRNLNARDTSNVDEIQPGGSAGYDLTGEGIVLGIWDGGTVLDSHEQFNPGSRVTLKDSSASDEHATHVACTMAGDGAPDSDAMGMAPWAVLESWDFYGDVATEMANSIDAYAASNHSWGSVAGWHYDSACPPDYVYEWVWHGDSCDNTEDPIFGKYGVMESTVDALIVDSPRHVVVAAAGNDRGDGPDSRPFNRSDSSSCEECDTTPPATDGNPDGSGYDSLAPWSGAKNVIAVAAVLDIVDDPVAGSDIVTTYFSSYGPVDDGRVKPDLAANGWSLYSAVNSADDAYDTMSGTSMSAPVVTGICALLAEAYSTNSGGELPNASLTKAILINTAIDDSDPRDGPDYRIGWGLADARGAADLMADHYASERTHWREGTHVGTEIVEKVSVSGGEPFTVTLVWTDPAGLPNTAGLDDNAPTLVNDLDLTLESPSGKVFRPWGLDPDNPDAPATRGENHVDNVEQIDVPVSDAEAGRWTLRIGNTGALQGGAQSFSLVVGHGASLEDYPFIDIISVYPVEATTCGKVAKLWVKVQNTGQTAFPSGTKIWFWANGPDWSGSHWLDSVEAGGLAVGETRWYSLDWTVPAGVDSGSYRYYAQAWYDGESVSGWSQRQDFDILCPQASITSLWPVQDTACTEDATLWALVKNTGNTAFPSSTKIWFWMNGPGWSGSNWVGVADAAGLAAGDKGWYSFDWTVPPGAQSGSYNYYAQAWYDGERASTWSEGQTFEVSCPEASIKSLWPVDGAACGTDATLWAQVQNTGDTAFPSGVMIWFWANGPDWSGSHWVGSVDAGGLGAGDTGWYFLNWSVPENAVGGSYAYYGQAWYKGNAVSTWSPRQDFDVSCSE
jgi:hypothetical protein